MQNMFDNPGFEPSTDAHLIVVASGATSTTLPTAPTPEKSSGYWVGATASVRTGAAAGDNFTITSYTADGAYTYGSCETQLAAAFPVRRWRRARGHRGHLWHGPIRRDSGGIRSVAGQHDTETELTTARSMMA